ncbi:MAG: baseplate J/gp47 family protein, partial [Plesiomonas shigelloides]
MAFQIKDFVSISASMLNHIRGVTTKITDLMPGSVSRTLVEAPAVEIEELYLQIFNGLREAIPVATFKSFRFDKLPAKYARGFVSVSAKTAPAKAFVVPKGTVFNSTDGRSYLSAEDVTWSASAKLIRVPVIAEAPGVGYNISSGSIVSSPAFSSDYTISNAAINSGRDQETSQEQEARFASYIGSLSRGTNYACIYAAESTVVEDEAGNIVEYVTRSGFTEIAGYVKIFIYSSSGLPSRDLIALGQRTIDGWKEPDSGIIIPGYRAGGVNIEVASMVERAVPLKARVSTFSNYVLDDAMQQAIYDSYSTLLSGVRSGETLYVDAIETAILSVAGIKSVVLDATDNLECGAGEALIPG